MSKMSARIVRLRAEAVETWQSCWGLARPFERLALAFLAFTTWWCVIRQPYAIIVPGSQVNLFGGLVCLVMLLAAWLAERNRLARMRSPAFVLSLVFLLAAVLCGMMSPYATAAVLRALVVVFSSLAGFWSARIILNTPARQSAYIWLCALLLGLFLLLTFYGYLAHGDVHFLFDAARHPQVTLTLLLWFAPLSLIAARRFPHRFVGLLLLALSLVFFFLSGLRSAVLMPAVIGGIALLLGLCRLRTFLLTLIGIAVIGLAFFHFFPEKRMQLAGEPLYYRLENYPFSLHIANKHPLFGIGLRSPRDGYLGDYEITYPYVDKETFAWTMRRVTVSENIGLTLLVGLGYPVTLLYGVVVVWLLIGLIRQVRSHPAGRIAPPLALLLPFSAALAHFIVYDGLLHPQIAFFFHLLPGLLPLNEQSSNGGNAVP